MSEIFACHTAKQSLINVVFVSGLSDLVIVDVCVCVCVCVLSSLYPV